MVERKLASFVYLFYYLSCCTHNVTARGGSSLTLPIAFNNNNNKNKNGKTSSSDLHYTLPQIRAGADADVADIHSVDLNKNGQDTTSTTQITDDKSNNGSDADVTDEIIANVELENNYHEIEQQENNNDDDEEQNVETIVEDENDNEQEELAEGEETKSPSNPEIEMEMMLHQKAELEEYQSATSSSSSSSSVVNVDDEEYDESEDEEEEEVEQDEDENNNAEEVSEYDSDVNSEEEEEKEDDDKLATSPSYQQVDKLRNNALQLRIKGKELHDDGDFTLAAQTFQEASVELEQAISICTGSTTTTTTTVSASVSASASDEEESENETESDEEETEEEEEEEEDEVTEELSFLVSDLAEECATCRLHQALCHLKNKNYEESIQSCTDVLMDGVQIIHFEEEEEVEEGEEDIAEDGEETDEEEEEDASDVEEDEEDEAIAEEEEEEGATTTTSKSSKRPAFVRITPNGGAGGVSTIPPTVQLSAAVRARAFHRRAKARLALGDTSGALEDARSAAFLGDRNAVALYGKLMRESGTSSHGASGDDGGMGGIMGQDLWGSRPNGEGSGSSLGSLFSSPSALEGMFSGSGDSSASPFSGNSPSMDLLGSLLGSRSDSSSDDSPTINPLNPFGDIGKLMMGSSAGGDGQNALAKSMISSLTKRIEDESTQEKLCNFLGGLDTNKLTNMSSMAGVSLDERTAGRLVGIANKITPKLIRRIIKFTKRILMVGKTLRKVSKVIAKYKHVIILLVLIQWIKSAILRPVVVNKRVARKAAKMALNEALSSGSFIL